MSDSSQPNELGPLSSNPLTPSRHTKEAPSKSDMDEMPFEVERSRRDFHSLEVSRDPNTARLMAQSLLKNKRKPEDYFDEEASQILRELMKSESRQI